MAGLADPSYLTLQGVPDSLRQVPNHLSHHFGQCLSDTLELWDNGQPTWVPYSEGLTRHFGGLSIFSNGGPPMTKDKASLASHEEVCLVHLDPSGGSQAPLLPRMRSSGSPWSVNPWWRSPWSSWRWFFRSLRQIRTSRLTQTVIHVAKWFCTRPKHCGHE